MRQPGQILSGIVLVGALFFSGQSLAAELTPDATAQYLAGLQNANFPRQIGTLDRAWNEHAAEFNRAWSQLEKRQLSKIRDWAPQFLGESYQDTATMFYMFSGPDFLYANAFFPAADTYILCGIEPVGAIPDLTKIPPAALPFALVNLRKSLESVLSWSFFITKNMKSDLRQTQLNGTLPVLYVFLARARCTINSVELVALDRAGNLVAAEQGSTPGVRISFTSEQNRTQTLFYFASDLSDSAVEANGAFLKFCAERAPGLTLLKAASYLMHGFNFERVRDFLLAQSSVIVEDDSGIPLRFFDPKKWTLRYCGRYVGPIPLFKQHPQPDLTRVFATTVPAPLDFGFGYQWQPNRSSLLIARPRAALALPPEEETEEATIGKAATITVPDDD